MILRPKSHSEEVALFRSEIVGALVRRDLSRGELKRELEALSLVRFRVPGSACTRSYSVPTLQRWYYAYRTGGLRALHPQPRQDRGHGRALSTDARELLCQIRRENPCASHFASLENVPGLTEDMAPPGRRRHRNSQSRTMPICASSISAGACPTPGISQSSQPGPRRVIAFATSAVSRSDSAPRMSSGRTVMRSHTSHSTASFSRPATSLSDIGTS